jgi:extradiol dioxygenase family protein
MATAALPPFHLAIPVLDIAAARHFYGEVLGFGQGRSAERWTDWNVEGHQVVTLQVAATSARWPEATRWTATTGRCRTSGWCSVWNGSRSSRSG